MNGFEDDFTIASAVCICGEQHTGGSLIRSITDCHPASDVRWFAMHLEDIAINKHRCEAVLV